MPVTVLCPSLKCRAVLSVPDGTRGKTVKCRFCGTTFVVPQAKPNPQAAAAKAAAQTADDEETVE